MKILFVTHNNNEKSGANRSIISLIERFNKDYEVVVLVNKTEGNLPDVLEKLGIQVVRMRYWWSCVPTRSSVARNVAVISRGYLRLLQNEVAVRKLVKLIKDENIGVVYTNTSTITFSSTAAQKANVAHVWHLREFGDKDFNFRRLLPRSSFVNRLNYGKLIAVSNSISDYYKGISSSCDIETVYNGLDISLFKNKFIPRVDNSLNLLIVGQLSKNKGQDQAIKAVKLFNEKYSPNYKASLFIAGRGDQYFLQSEMKKAGSPYYIHYLGQVENLAEVRANMHAALVCSSSEAFGRVTLESMLSGLPVIGADTAGTGELIINGMNGLLYKNKDENDLALKIHMLLDDSLRKRLSDAAFLYASNFSISHTYDDISTIIINLDK